MRLPILIPPRESGHRSGESDPLSGLLSHGIVNPSE